MALFARLLPGLLTLVFALHAQAQPQSPAPGGDQARSNTDQNAADALFRKGLELASRDQFSEAASAFDQAYRASPHFAVLYNAAQAHQRAGHLVKAWESFQRYLDEGGSAVPPKRASEVREQAVRLRERLGEVTVSVSPADASLFLDGAQASPDRPILLEPGEHMLLVVRAGLSSEHRLVRVHARETVPVSVTLSAPPSAPPASGWLAVECSVPAVRLTIDAQSETTIEGRAWIRSSPGLHRVELQRAGYRPDVRSVTVVSDRVSALRCEMKPLEPLALPWKARLVVKVHPADAELFVDEAPLPASGEVPVGLHRLRAARSGYLPWTRDVALEARQPTRLALSLRPTQAHADEYRARVARRRNWSYGFLGAGGLLTSVAGYLFIDARSDWTRWHNRQDELDAAWTKASADQTGPVAEQGENDALARSVQSETQVAILLGAIGLSALAEGVYLYLTADSESE